MTSINAQGQHVDPRRGRVEPVASPLPRRESLELLASLVAMLGVIFLLALTMGASPLGQR
jgi:hypothetical protein